MAGLVEKMLEYLVRSAPLHTGRVHTAFQLETRIDAHNEAEEEAPDTCLEDFLLTYSIYIPSSVICQHLKTSYERRNIRGGSGGGGGEIVSDAPAK